MSPSLTRALTALSLVAGTGVTMLLMPRVAVEGPSMIPTLQPGDRLVVLPARAVPVVIRPFIIRTGRLVVATDPRDPGRLLVKRATATGRAGVIVRGDNADHSTDSRTFGPIPTTLVIGRPLYRYSPAGTAGWLWRN